MVDKFTFVQIMKLNLYSMNFVAQKSFNTAVTIDNSFSRDAKYMQLKEYAYNYADINIKRAKMFNEILRRIYLSYYIQSERFLEPLKRMGLEE